MYRSLFALLVLFSSSQALACPPPPPIAPLPGEKTQAFQERMQAALAAEAFEERRTMQSALLDKSSAAFIGVVTNSREIEVAPVKGHEVIVRPARAIKGELPEQPVMLRDSSFTTCGLGGGGSATSAEPGDYVIVFTGLPANIGIIAKDAELPDLRTALAIYGRDSRN